MLYDRYRSRMNKLADVFAVARRFRVLIITLCLSAIAVTAGFLGLSGLVYDTGNCPVSITVGEKLTYGANAVFNSVNYEFSAKGTEVWTAEQPTRPGEYLVRTYSESAFGTNRYGSVHAFTILPRTVEVKVEQSEITYGELPTVTAELCYDDKIHCSRFIYKDIASPHTVIRADVNSITVTDVDGNDVTDSYVFRIVNGEITFGKRELNIIFEDYETEYDGKVLEYKTYAVSEETPVADGDTVAVADISFGPDAGTAEIKPEIKIYTKDDGIDVTGNYKINVIFNDTGVLTIKKRPIYVTTHGFGKVYDGKLSTFAEYTVQEESKAFMDGLGHSFEVIKTTPVCSVTEEGGVDNVILDFKVYGENGEDVTDNYSVLYVSYGKLSVAPRPVIINSVSDASQIFDGGEHFNTTTNTLLDEGKYELADGDYIEVTEYTKAVRAGSYENIISAIIKNAAGDDVSKNYLISYSYGTLTIQPRPVYIEPVSVEEYYDGEVHIANEYAVRANDGRSGLIDGHKETVDEESFTTRTLVGTTVISGMVFGIKNEEDNWVTSDYKVEIMAGTLTVLPRPVIMMPAHAEKVYDTTPLTSTVLTAAEGGFGLVQGHTASAVTEGSRTDTGESENVVADIGSIEIFDADGNPVTGNYEILGTQSGTLTVTKRPVTIVTGSQKWVYDGETHIFNKGDIFGADWITEDKYSLSLSGNSKVASITDVGSKDNEIDGVLIRLKPTPGCTFEEEIDVTHNYAISYLYGKLTVTPRTVTVTPQGKSFVYNGEPHSYGGHTVENLVKGHETKVSKEIASITDIKQNGVKNEIEVYVVDAAGEPVNADNYNIVYAEGGELSIIPRQVKLITESYNKWVYDAQPHSHAGHRVENIVEGQTTEAYNLAEITEVKDNGKQNTMSVRFFNGTDEVTDNYEITETVCGTLTINKRPITVKADDKTKEYDGTPLFLLKTEISELNGSTDDEGLVKGHLLYNPEFEGSVTDAESKDVIVTSVEIVCVYETGIDYVTDNYDITYEKGTLTVTGRKITVTANDATKIYDGTALVCEDKECGSTRLVKGHTIDYDKIVYEGSKTDAGTEFNVIKEGSVTVLDENGVDVTKNYEITRIDGILTVEQRKVTVTTGNKHWVYDAEEHFWLKDFKVSELTESTGLIKGHTAEADETEGTYTPVRDAKWRKTEEGLLVLSYENDHKVLIKDAKGDDVTKNYEIEYVCGILSIEPIHLYLTTGTREFDYDGNPHSEKVISVTHYNLVNNEKVEHIVEGGGWATVTNVYDGEVENVVSEIYVRETVKGSAEKTDVTSNYYVDTCKWGTLTVARREITVVADDDTKIYNGEFQTGSKFKVAEASANPLVEGHKIAATTNEVGANIGTYKIKVEDDSAKIFNGKTDESGNYKILYGSTEADFIITERQIIITAGDESKIYDGNPLTFAGEEDYKNYKITSDYVPAVVKGQSVTVTVKGSLTDAGSEKINEIATVKITGTDGTDLTANYSITTVNGTLTVNPRPITVTAGDETKVYDGNPLTFADEKDYKNYEITSDYAPAVVKDQDVTVTVKGSLTEVGSETVNEIATVTIRSKDGKDVTGNYGITTVNGTLTVTKRPLYIKTESNEEEWIYYGGEFSLAYYAVRETDEESGLVSDHKTVLTEAVFVVDAGTYDNVLKVTVKDKDGNGVDVSKNYSIIYEYGTLTVERRIFTLYTETREKEYDGYPLVHKVYAFGDDYGDAGIIEGHTFIPYEWASRTEIGEEDNSVNDWRITAIIDGKVCDVSENYLMGSVWGKLIVTEPTGGSEGGDLGDGESSGSDRGEPRDAVKVTSDVSGRIYLRYRSFGNGFDGHNFVQGVSYGDTIFIDGNAYGANYLASLALMAEGRFKSYGATAQIEVLGSEYYLPYYMYTDGTDYDVQSSDVFYTGTSKKYSLKYCLYDYVADGRISAELGSYSGFEDKYYEFVKNNYLAVDAQTLAFMNAIISSSGFVNTDPEIISKVASYIQNAAVYNLDFDADMEDREKTENVVIAFLRDYKEGVCRHYSKAATMLYRALGIPARYVIGYVGTTVAGEEVTITTENAHAWVEVYIKGFGWVQVEVTGSGFNDGSGGEQSGWGDVADDYADTEIAIKPADSYKIFDGEPLSATKLEANIYLRELTALGFTYKVNFTGSRTETGYGESEIQNFTLYDPDGKNVTSLFNINREAKGGLYVLDNSKYDKIVYAHSNSKFTYDGTVRFFNADSFYFSFEPEGFRLTDGYSAKISISDHAGFKDATVITGNDERFTEVAAVTVYKDGIIDEKCFVVYDVLFEIGRRAITLTTNSVTREYRYGEPLTDGTYTISGEGIVAGQTDEAVEITSIEEVGEAVNKVTVKISDGEEDVTKNYKIHKNYGKLTIVSE